MSTISFWCGFGGNITISAATFSTSLLRNRTYFLTCTVPSSPNDTISTVEMLVYYQVVGSDALERVTSIPSRFITYLPNDNEMFSSNDTQLNYCKSCESYKPDVCYRDCNQELR